MNFQLTEDQQKLLADVRQFRREVIDPLIPHRREWVLDPTERFPWEAVEAGSRLGLRTLTVPKEYGGRGVGALELSLAVEELAFGDMGIAVIFDQTWKVAHMIAELATKTQRDEFFPRFVDDDRFLLAVGVAEPEHSTDVPLSKRLLSIEDKRVSMITTATEEADAWVIEGHKMMPSLASTAKLVVVLAQTEPERAIHDGCTYFMLPSDTPGFSVDKVWDKVSQRLADNAAISFHGCRVGKDAMLGERGSARTHPTTSGGNIEAAATTLGTARAAFEAATGWATERVQGGRPLIEHQAVGMVLAEMAAELEAARTLVWKAAVKFDEGDTKTPLQFMAKWYAAEVAVRVCVKAMEVFGGKGILLDMPVQKYLRDCLSFLHSDGTQHSRLMLIQQQLIDGGPPSISSIP